MDSTALAQHLAILLNSTSTSPRGGERLRFEPLSKRQKISDFQQQPPIAPNVPSTKVQQPFNAPAAPLARAQPDSQRPRAQQLQGPLIAPARPLATVQLDSQRPWTQQPEEAIVIK